MKQVLVRLHSMQDVLRFVKIMEKEEARADIIWGQYRLRATSFLGILNMDLNHPLQVTMYDDQTKCNQVVQKLEDYLVAEH